MSAVKGVPAHALEKFPVSGSSFEAAWELLRERYKEEVEIRTGLLWRSIDLRDEVAFCILFIRSFTFYKLAMWSELLLSSHARLVFEETSVTGCSFSNWLFFKAFFGSSQLGCREIAPPTLCVLSLERGCNFSGDCFPNFWRRSGVFSGPCTLSSGVSQARRPKYRPFRILEFSTFADAILAVLLLLGADLLVLRTVRTRLGLCYSTACLA
ncbi:hypothetical protein K0M31_015268 [Melipona bicolor]|uniref:Uncharacterized protein n=1 Tax=Melipona bicolor TaxID=60889 RepID=A0AA40FFS5_9HYME|nr:hypothetical protein K0M31_015268 [Melipona bicolor]